MEKHSYLMMLDSDHTFLNALKQLVIIESSDKNSRQSPEVLGLSHNNPDLVLVDITLPEMNSEKNKAMEDGSVTPVIKVTARCEIAALSDVLEMIIKADFSNESIKAMDSVSLIMSNLRKTIPAKFNLN